MADLGKMELQILLKAYQSGVLVHHVTNAAKSMAEMGFGMIRGRKWIWEKIDRTRVRDFLVHACGIENPDYFHVDFKELTRIQTALHIPEEKYAGRKPRAGLVLLRGAHGKVYLNGAESQLIADANLEVPVANIQSVEHDCMLAVENFEAFRAFEQLQIRNFPFQNPLIVYRGDTINFPDAAKNLLARAVIPVVAFADFDPQGLNIAAAIPKCVGAIFPADLEGLNRNDLFAKQRILLGPLEKYPVPWHDLIQYMLAVRHCMTQEHMFAHDVPFEFLSVNNGNVLFRSIGT